MMSAVQSPADDYVPASSKIPVQELIPFCACLCFMTSLYTDFPDCFGCAGTRICLCCYSEFKACKLPNEHEKFCFLWDQGKTQCGDIDTFCMQRAHVFCLDTRCAIPLSDDIPVMMTCCFFTFFTKEEFGPFSCFRSVAEIEEDRLALNSPSPPPPQQQPRPPVPLPSPAKVASPVLAPALTPTPVATTSSNNNTETTSSPMAPTVQNI